MELTTLRGWVKQIKTERLDDHSRELIEGCFPEFLNQQKISNWLASADVSLSLGAKETFTTGHGRLRRFAGDQTLPGGRYFALCNDKSGTDGGTLVWELMSYWTAHCGFRRMRTVIPIDCGQRSGDRGQRFPSTASRAHSAVSVSSLSR
jgi:hypothetical protein